MNEPTPEDMEADLTVVQGFGNAHAAARRAIHAEKEVERLQSLLKEWQALAERYAPGVAVRWLKEKN